ncbi:DNA cytosine methyltransferase [Candidatus Saccharibacteria bacterium]|nr:DNA cytosine methyltransferase [Candidatus Saccharibacteria bacterium]
MTKNQQALFPLEDTKINVWDKEVPVEKSSYLTQDVEYINYDNLSAPKDKYTMVDLFCGAGGFAVAGSMAGFFSVLGNDHLKPAMTTWCKNHPNSLGVVGDIEKLNPEHLRKMLEDKGITHINLMTGGVPCQGFSLANRKHNDFDERNFLFLEYMRFIKEFMPDYVILENVSGMRIRAGGKFEQDIKAAITELGYNVSVKLLTAADFGVPQIRKRLVFVGVKKDSGLVDEFVFPEGEFAEKKLCDKKNGKKPWRTVYDAISDLPKLGNSEFAEDYSDEPKTEYQKIMRGLDKKYNIKKADKLYNHTAPTHPQETIDRIANTKQGEPMYEKFRQRIRLVEDEPSPTQLAGGIRPQFQFGHPTQPRGLTIRERARIQSFPDSYIFCGGTVQERVQTGNAVPPLMIYALAKEIAKDLDRKYKKKS